MIPIFFVPYTKLKKQRWLVPRETRQCVPSYIPHEVVNLGFSEVGRPCELKVPTTQCRECAWVGQQCVKVRPVIGSRVAPFICLDLYAQLHFTKVIIAGDLAQLTIQSAPGTMIAIADDHGEFCRSERPTSGGSEARA